VCAVERMPRVGGAATHLGTIPSKSLRHAIFQLAEANKNPLLRTTDITLQLSFAQLRKTSSGVIERQVDMRPRYYEPHDLTVLYGFAGFVDDHTIEVEQAGGARQRVSADAFIIASGARPYHPPDVDFDHPRIFDSDKILALDQTPSSITIYGAGVVGCEYCSMFRNLNVKVNLINTRAKL